MKNINVSKDKRILLFFLKIILGIGLPFFIFAVYGFFVYSFFVDEKITKTDMVYYGIVSILLFFIFGHRFFKSRSKV